MSKTSQARWHRLRFSLRTLFVIVTVFGVWLGWELNTVRERQVMRRQIEASGGEFCEMQSGFFVTIREADPSCRASAFRRLLGDKDEETIVFPRQPSAIDIEGASFFPEAEVLTTEDYEMQWSEWLKSSKASGE